MATNAIVFFDSRLAFDELEGMPQRLLGECPSVAECVDDWTSPFAWEGRSAEFPAKAAAERWSSFRDVYLFCPIGHLEFRRGSVAWNGFVRWSWLKDGPDRDHLMGRATELARVFGATHGLVTNDSGGDDAVLDVPGAGGSVADAIASITRSGAKPAPLMDVPFVGSPYHTVQF